MEIKIANFGPISKADFKLADLTFICGKNNTGKSYLAHLVFGFINSYKYNIRNYLLDALEININSTKKHINLVSFLNQNNEETVRTYKEHLNKFYNKNQKEFIDTKLSIDIDFVYNLKHSSYLDDLTSNKLTSLYYDYLTTLSSEFVFNLTFIEKEASEVNFEKKLQDKKNALGLQLSRRLSNAVFGKCYICCAERSSLAVFYQNLPNKYGSESINIYNKYEPKYPNYIEKEIQWMGEKRFVDLDRTKNTHKLLKQIAGGTYDYSEDEDDFMFISNDSQRLRLQESSSTVRNMLNIYYAVLQAKKGDLLIIDEPELNLHPANQRLFARLLAILINDGIQVMITTHSDYMIKELNNLILFEAKKDEPYAQNIRQKLLSTYSDNMFIDLDKKKLNVYQTEPCNESPGKFTLTHYPVTKTQGVEIPGFDEEIIDMNTLQEELLFGDYDDD